MRERAQLANDISLLNTPPNPEWHQTENKPFLFALAQLNGRLIDMSGLDADAKRKLAWTHVSDIEATRSTNINVKSRQKFENKECPLRIFNLEGFNAWRTASMMDATSDDSCVRTASNTHARESVPPLMQRELLC